jgi:predicted XRE-type DNA-binding protein
MDANKKKKMEAAGWRIGDAKDFLGLSASEMEYIELKLALARNLVSTRKAKRLTQIQLAEKLHSSQSRVAKMEAGDASVSIDLLIRSLFELDISKSDLAKVIKSSPIHGTKKAA